MKMYSEEELKSFKKKYDDLATVLEESKQFNGKRVKSSLDATEKGRIYNERVKLKQKITSVAGYEELIGFSFESDKDEKRSKASKKGHENRKKKETVALSDGALSVMSLMQKLTCFQEKWNLVIKHLAEVDKLLTI